MKLLPYFLQVFLLSFTTHYLSSHKLDLDKLTMLKNKTIKINKKKTTKELKKHQGHFWGKKDNLKHLLKHNDSFLLKINRVTIFTLSLLNKLLYSSKRCNSKTEVVVVVKMMEYIYHFCYFYTLKSSEISLPGSLLLKIISIL